MVLSSTPLLAEQFLSQSQPKQCVWMVLTSMWDSTVSLVEQRRAHMDMSHMELARDVFVLGLQCVMAHRYGFALGGQESKKLEAHSRAFA